MHSRPHRAVSFAIAMLLALPAARATAKDYHVDASADAPGNGSSEAPFTTISQAAERMEAGDTCYLHTGVYRETVRPARSGSRERPMTFTCAEGETAIVTGCESVSAWEAIDDHVFRAEIDAPLADGTQVFSGDRMLFEARWPNVTSPAPMGLLEFPMATMDKGTTRTTIVDDAIPQIGFEGASVWVSSHKRWYCWTGRITGARAGAVQLQDQSDAKGNHVCKPGGYYYLFGARSLLDHEDEWVIDDGSLYVWSRAPRETPSRIEIKVRPHAFDLSGRHDIVIRGLHIFGASIVTDDASRFVTLDRLQAKYVDHSNRAVNQYSSQSGTGIRLRGHGHVVTNCEIAYSSGNCLVVYGRDCKIINNYIHDGNYMGTYASPLSFLRGSRDNVASHNTITRAGRTTIGTSGLYHSILQFNDVSFAGYLTDDLGLTYGNGVEGGNSEVRYNWFHDNVASSHNMGLYFDHGCKNLVFHHNVIWNVADLGMINNQYANYLLYYNNTVADAKRSYQSAWAAAQAKDLYGCRLVNTLGTADTRIQGEGLHTTNNTWNYGELTERHLPTAGTEPIDSARVVPGINNNFVGAGPDRGAYELGKRPWRAGHDFQSPPREVDTSFRDPAHRNRIRNAAFHAGTLDEWKPFGNHVRVVHDSHSQWITDAKTMMGGYSATLGRGHCGLRQTVDALEAGATYELMAMFRVSEGEAARIGVRVDGQSPTYAPPITAGAPHWKRTTLRFTLGPHQTSAEIILERTSSGSGDIYVDDPGLQLVESEH